jgi:hypothetical protein
MPLLLSGGGISGDTDREYLFTAKSQRPLRV